jgi:hypothetical protein
VKQHLFICDDGEVVSTADYDHHLVEVFALQRDRDSGWPRAHWVSVGWDVLNEEELAKIHAEKEKRRREDEQRRREKELRRANRWWRRWRRRDKVPVAKVVS